MSITQFVAAHQTQVKLGSTIGLAVGICIIIFAAAWNFFNKSKEERQRIIAEQKKIWSEKE